MTQTEYEQKKRECWDEFRIKNPAFNDMLGRKIFNQIFDRAYALGKQEKEAEGEEMLPVEKSRVQQQYKRATQLKDDSDSKWELVGDQIERVLIGLYGSKCLPDELTEDNFGKSDVPSSKPEPAENLNIDNPFEKQTPLSPEVEKLIDEMTTKMAEDATKLLREYCEKLDKKPVEPKFNLGNKVKDISSPHDVGIYTVDGIKKSSDGFIYHIQGVIGKSNVKESDLEPYTEPEEKTSEKRVENEQERVENEQSRNLSQSMSNCDKCPKSVQKTHPDFGHSRLNIAAMAMQGMLSNTTRFSSYEISDLVRISLNCADSLLTEAERGGKYGED